MTRIIWHFIKEKLIYAFFEVDLKYYDLGIRHRDETDDQVTIDAANAIKEYGVGVKCATITPNAGRVKEYNLKQQWKSPNGTIRSILDGTVFSKPIIIKNIPPGVKSWKKPIIIGRHAYGDIYKDAEMVVDAGTAEIVFTPAGGGEKKTLTIIHEFKDPGVVMAMHNTEKSIRSFAKACINYALSEKTDIWFGAKDTISKQYHGFFRDVFADEVEKVKDRLQAAGIQYRYMLRLKNGMLPMCVSTCIARANYFGDPEDKDSLIYKMMKTNKTGVLSSVKGESESKLTFAQLKNLTSVEIAAKVGYPGKTPVFAATAPTKPRVYYILP